MLLPYIPTYIKRFFPYLPWAILGLAGAITLNSLIGFWQILSDESHRPKSTATSHAPRADQSIDIESLFGQSPTLMKMADGGLTLRGIFTAHTPEAGSAIIATQGKQPKLYIVGDRLPNGGKLMAVHDTEVVIEKDGQQSMLLLPATRI